jgi:hypothetical protein
MGLFDKIKSAVGVGNPKLSLDLDPPVFSWGLPIAGSILLAAQERATPVKSITLRLVCDADVVEPDGRKLSRRTEVAETTMPFAGDGHLFAAHQKRRFDFSLDPGDGGGTVDGATYTLLASADCPGLDPSTSMVITRVEPPEVETLEIEPATSEGMLAIRSIFVPPLAAVVGDTPLLIPRFRKVAFEPGQSFDKTVLTPELMDTLCGRTVFSEGLGNNFGVLMKAAKEGEYVVAEISSGCTSLGNCDWRFVKCLSLARFKGPEGDPLTYLDLYEGQERDEAALDRDTFKQHIHELRSIYPDAVL